MTPKALLQILAAFLILFALGAGGCAALSYRQMAQRVTTLEVTAKQFDELQKSVDALQKEAVRRASLDKSIRDSRAAVIRSVETASNETPAVAGYLHQRIPDELRNAHFANRAVPPTVRH